MTDDAMQTLKDTTEKLLVSEYDFTIEDAAEAVDESSRTNPGMWHENSEAAELAKLLASDDSDE